MVADAPRRRTLWLALLTLGFATYALLCVYSLYRARHFAFHDLTLITDWLTNALYEGRPFYITDYGVNHLQRHFTPSLLLLAPVYALFASQFVLLAAGVAAYALALFLLLQITDAALDATSLRGSPGRRALITVAVFLLLALNRFGKTVLLSGHFEIFFLPGAMGLVFALARDAPRWIVGLLLAVTLGVRQDAGFFLFFFLVSLAWLPRPLIAHPARFRRRLAAVAALALGYTVALVGVAFPALGASQSLELWREWGPSWGVVLWNLLTSPARVLRAVAASGFLPLNASLYFLPVLSPVVTILVNLPGLLFYTIDTTMDTANRRFLWYYNSAFLLPGLYLATVLAVHRLVSWVDGVRATPRLRRTLGWAVAFGLAALAVANLVNIAQIHPAASRGPFSIHRIKRDDVVRGIRRALASCPAIGAVATDFRNIVFVPNRYRKYLLRNYRRADAVFLATGADLTLTGAGSDAEIRSTLDRDPGFVVRYADPSLRIYFRADLGC